MLVELLRHAQFITFNRIRKDNLYSKVFRLIINEKRPSHRKKGLDLIDECMKETSKRDKNEQSNMVNEIYRDINREMKDKNIKNTEPEHIYGITTVLRSLFFYANKEVIEDISWVLDFALSLQASKSERVLVAALDIYPVLASYNPEAFMNHRQCLDKVIEMGVKILRDNSTNIELRKGVQICLAKVLEPYTPDKVLDRAKLVLDELIAKFKQVWKGYGEPSLIYAMVTVSEKIHREYTVKYSEEQIHDLVNHLLGNGITEDIINYLEFLAKICRHEVNYIIQIKLLLTISYILTDLFYHFQLVPEIETKYKQHLLDFKTRIDENLKKLNDMDRERGENLFCVSLRCLSRFKFTEFNDQMVN